MPSLPGGPRTNSTRTNSQAARMTLDAKLACWGVRAAILLVLHCPGSIQRGFWARDGGGTRKRSVRLVNLVSHPQRMTSRSHFPVTEKAGVSPQQLIGQPIFLIFGQPLAGIYNKRCRALYPQVPDSHLLSLCPSQRPRTLSPVSSVCSSMLSSASPKVTAVVSPVVSEPVYISVHRAQLARVQFQRHAVPNHQPDRIPSYRPCQVFEKAVVVASVLWLRDAPPPW
ncbi:hypothetical protein FB45DRAFT_31003 [Roridomyces roridus]|uniref:Uncharacterized protein n=1 Tax=Roridomyces roridus TaxID=1738132 RepID=A0AAD7CKG0_9AGAR|nr:hypothetical protein FB45DRAFT_31003 [Roridomyces roridus]